MSAGTLELQAFHRGPVQPQYLLAEDMTIPPGDRQGIDSAFPLSPEPDYSVVLIYAGGDTVHPWTTQEIKDMPNAYANPTWVRSNPVDTVNDGAVEGAAFLAWLHGHAVPMGVCVTLDLETAVATNYVNGFNGVLASGGYKVIKYGSQSTIWQNPKTNGGTYVADPTGTPHMDTVGDTVATQYAFDGSFDLSLYKSQSQLPLWALHADPPPRNDHWVTLHGAPADVAIYHSPAGTLGFRNTSGAWVKVKLP